MKCPKCAKEEKSKYMIMNYDTGVYECAACFGKKAVKK